MMAEDHPGNRRFKFGGQRYPTLPVDACDLAPLAYFSDATSEAPDSCEHHPKTLLIARMGPLGVGVDSGPDSDFGAPGALFPDRPSELQLAAWKPR